MRDFAGASRPAGHEPAEPRHFNGLGHQCAYNPAMREFSRIKRLPPYVFNITNELKMAARRRGDDIIDLSMGNPDGPTPKHIVEKLVEASQRIDTHGYSVSRGIPRLKGGLRVVPAPLRRRASIRTPRRSSPSARRRAGAPDARVPRARRHGARAEPFVPDPHLRRDHRRADIRSVRMTPGIDFFAELERAIRELTPKPRMLVIGFPSNPTAQCVEVDFSKG